MAALHALLERGVLRSGQVAFMAGAAGGVSHFGVQFAKITGARTIGTGSAHNREFVLGLGADEYVDYTEQDVADVVQDADVALDAVGGETTASLVPAVRPGGILVTIASAPPEDAAGERGVRPPPPIHSPGPPRPPPAPGTLPRRGGHPGGR